MNAIFFNKMLIAIAITSIVFFASCSSEEDGILNYGQDTAGAETRGTLTTTDTITFEGIGSAYMAGPTSYGENTYDAYSGTQIVPYVHPATGLKFGLNGAGGSSPVNFWDGGFVISKWHYQSNIPGQTGDWWYSYLNQCSVYSGTDGSNNNGGAGGSSNFAVMFGYVDFFNSTYATYPKIEFTSGSGVIESLKVCLNSYAYGVIKYGNTFGNVGEAEPLEDSNGYFKLLAYGFNGSTATNGGVPVEIYLTDYRITTIPSIPPVITWTKFNLSALGTVTRVEFNMEGSDSGAYGLNTPAYVCMDDVVVTK